MPEPLTQIMVLKDPAWDISVAEIILRPANLLAVEAMIRPPQGAAARRRRQEFAQKMAFVGTFVAQGAHVLS